jgi:hypothetical protein
MADGTFTGTHSNDDGLTRFIGDDGQGGNTFETTRTQEPGIGSGTYAITPDGVVTVTFGYSEFDDVDKYSSFGIGVVTLQ